MPQSVFLAPFRREHPVKIDMCMASIVEQLNRLGIETWGCCCGHGKENAMVWIAGHETETILPWRCFLSDTFK